MQMLPRPARWPKPCSRPAWSTASISDAISSPFRRRRRSNGNSWSRTSCRSFSTISCSTRRYSRQGSAAGIDIAADEPSFEEDPADADIIDQIKELLETRVRPAVAQDGGDIVYRGYKDGKLYLGMQGACAGCPSSMVTLKRGVESLIKHYVPEVETIEAV